MNVARATNVRAQRGAEAWILSVLVWTSIGAACSPTRNTASAVREETPHQLTLAAGERGVDLASLSSALRAYQEKTGIKVGSIPAYYSVQGTLKLLQQFFASHSKEPDLCEIDNVWPGILAEDLIDLQPYLGDELKDIDQGLLDAFTVHGRLVAIPLFMSTSVLYYRTDLLRKYGYHDPPGTWEELARMAKTIQDGERNHGAKDFWGYIWQGGEGEPLTCNAMEWEHSEGVNLIDRSGAIRATDPAAEYAIRRARAWVGTISPRSIVEYDETDSDSVWLNGSAAFARSWLNLYNASKNSPILGGRFAIAPMPSGSKGRAWAFGGLGIAVSKYSANPKAAVELARYLVSSEVQMRRLRESSMVPIRSSLLSNEALLQNTAFKGWLSGHWREGMFFRPSTLTGKDYYAVSSAYSKAVHHAISGERDTPIMLAQLQEDLTSLLKPRQRGSNVSPQ